MRSRHLRKVDRGRHSRCEGPGAPMRGCAPEASEARRCIEPGTRARSRRMALDDQRWRTRQRGSTFAPCAPRAKSAGGGGDGIHRAASAASWAPVLMIRYGPVTVPPVLTWAEASPACRQESRENTDEEARGGTAQWVRQWT